MPLEIDYSAELIKVTSPDTAIAGQALADFIEDQMSTPEGLLYGDVIQPEGKIEDPSNPGVYSQIIIILNSPWQVQFWQGSGYTRIYGAKLVGGLSDQPLKATGLAGDISVLESPVDGVTVAVGSGLSQEQDTTLTTIETQTSYQMKILDNKRILVKVGSTWYLRVFDDNGTTIIQDKALKDVDGNDITDIEAGALAQEYANSV